MTTEAKDRRYEAFMHGFVTARDPKNPQDTLLALQDAETAWARYCADNGFHVSLQEGAVIAWSRHETFVREALSQHETFVHGFIVARAAMAQHLSLLALDEAEIAWRVHLDHTEATAHV